MRSMSLLLEQNRGSAAAEMALVLPLLLIIMCGSLELGNYFWNEHVLVKGLRDGARYAARRSFTNYSGCSGAPLGTVQADTKNIVRTGQVAGGTDRLPNWSTATFTVTVSCTTTAGTQTLSGIYKDNTNSTGAAIGAPIVTVSASLPYRSLLGSFGFKGVGLSINAAAQAAVTGN